MPLVRISLRAIADGMQRAIADALGVPEGDRFQIIDQRPAEALIASPEYLGVSRQNVVFVNLPPEILATINPISGKKWVASLATAPATFFVYAPPVPSAPPDPPTTFAMANA